MIFEIHDSTGHEGLDRQVQDIHTRLEQFFGITWNEGRPNLILVRDRAQINRIKCRQTEDWVIGWLDGNTIYLLAPENFEKESCHRYSHEYYRKLIMHEMTHAFTSFLGRGCYEPLWLFEGIAVHASGQNEGQPRSDGFARVVDGYQRWNNEYADAGHAVAVLEHTQGREKLVRLIRNAHKACDKASFDEVFRGIYGFECQQENFDPLNALSVSHAEGAVC